MSEAPYLLERRRAARLHRFGLGLGIVLAALFHAALFWGPEVEYSPLLEEAKVRRVLIAQPYRPAAPPAPAPVPPPVPGRRQAAPQPPVVPAPQQAREPAPQPTVQPTPAPTPERGSRQAEATQAARTATSREGAAGARVEARTSQSAAQPDPGSEVWAQLMANLEARKEGIEQKRTALEAELAAAPRSDRRGAAGANGDGDGWLDPRIRVNVVSYPESSIERAHPQIPYPDQRFRQRELEKGICRVYYRIWTDTMGRIVRRQIKTPETRELQERYKAFVDVVAESVEEWPLDRMQAEIHIDVLFEIE